MPSNPQLYPLDFSADIPGVGSSQSATDIAVRDLQSQTRIAAIRQLQSRRQAGQGAINGENSRTTVLNNFLPASEIGKVRFTPGVNLGTKGFQFGGVASGGGTSLTSLATQTLRFTYAGEAIAPIDETLDSGNYGAGSGNGSDAFIAVGQRGTNRFNFATEKNQLVGAFIGTARFGMSSLGNLSSAFFFGGATGFYKVTTQIDEFPYGSLVYRAIDAQLSQPRSAMGAGGDANNAFLAGGYDYTPTFVNVINRFAMGTRVSSVLGETLATRKIWIAGTSSLVKVYFAGGNTGNNAGTGVIETVNLTAPYTRATIGATLSPARHVMGALQTSTAGYFLGGYGPSYTFYNAIEKITFATDVRSPVSATLPTAKQASCAISDYSAGIAA